MNKFFTYSVLLHSLHLHVSEEGWMWRVLREKSFTFTPSPPFHSPLSSACLFLNFLPRCNWKQFFHSYFRLMDGRQSAYPCVCLSICLAGWLVFLLCLSSCHEAISDRTEGENCCAWFTIRMWKYFMDILKILKYATCRVTDLTPTSLASAVVVLTFDPLVVCRLPFDHAEKSIQTKE